MVAENTTLCSECGKDANFYSSYKNEDVLFCSAPCHQKYNGKAETKNFILVKLEDKSKDGDENDGKDEEELSEVFRACHRGEGNYEKLKELLDNGESANQRNAKGQTLMTYSITKGEIRTLDALLGAGADVNEADGNSVTPLMVAANIGAVKKVEFLLQRDADVALVDSEGKTALHKITDTHKDTDCAKLLLEKSPSLIGVKDKFDQTALHTAAGEGNTTIVTLLLEHEANITEVDNLGRTPLSCSVLQKAEECVELFLNHQNGAQVVDVADRFGFCPIHYAIEHDNIRIVRMLIEKGCDVNKKDNRGQTALLCAVSHGRAEICKEIVQKCDSNAVDSQGFSALHHAASNGQVDICELLIKNGADVNIKDKKQQTCIYHAALNDDVKTVKMLIAKGAKCDASVKDENGRTPIHHAAEIGLPKMIKTLIEETNITKDSSKPESCTINLLDNVKESALYIAALNEHKECCQVLMDAGVIIDDRSKRHLINLGLQEEEKEEPPESPRQRYEPPPPPEEEKIEDLPIEPVVSPEEVVNNSRHITRKAKSDDGFIRGRRKNHKHLKALRVKRFPGHEASPYLQSMLSEDILYKKLRNLGMRPGYLSQSCSNLSSKSMTNLSGQRSRRTSNNDLSSIGSRRTSTNSHGKTYSYSTGS